MTLREDVSNRAEARVGQVLKAKWRLDAVLGIGGMATVYAATHRNQSRVAIKMLHPEVALSQDVTTRFLREGYVGNAVAHPGTVRVLDDDLTEDGAPFLVMELLEGESFGARLDRDGPFPPHEVALFGYQLLDVLAAAHAAHIVHRDLKPDNVFLTLDGRVKVLDFGIARLRAATHESSASTRVGSLLGTPAFMAPEQALGRWKEVDERTDIWAVGATLFTLLTGRFVHEAEAVQEQLVLAATSKAPSVSSLRPDVPPWLASIIDKALSFSRDARYPDARGMQAALRESGSGLEFPSYPMSAPGASRQYTPSAQTPDGVFSTPSPASAGSRPEPRPVSSPSFGEGATIVARSVSTPLPRQSAGTFASVQAVARSAQEPASERPSKAMPLALVALGFSAVVGAAAVLWLWRTPDAPGHGSSLPTAAVLPQATAATLPQPRTPPETATPSAATSAPPAPSAAGAHVAVNVVGPAATVKKQPLGSKPHRPPPPEQKENLFDRRH